MHNTDMILFDIFHVFQNIQEIELNLCKIAIFNILHFTKTDPYILKKKIKNVKLGLK